MSEILYLVLVVFFSSLVNSTFGFGFSLFSMPLLSLYFGLKLVGPLTPLLFVVGASIIIIKGWKDIAFKSILPLAIGATFAIPVGVYLGKHGPTFEVQIFLGIFIILFSIYNLVAPKLPKLENDKYGPLFGALSGLFDGAYNISGPPAVIYGSLRQWSPQVFRVSLQCYFLYSTLIVICTHIYMGSYNNPLIGQYFLYALPAMAIAVPIGKKINSSIDNPTRFNRYIYCLMLLSGLLVILSTLDVI